MNIKSITVALGAVEGESPKVNFHENGVPVKGNSLHDLYEKLKEVFEGNDLPEEEKEEEKEE